MDDTVYEMLIEKVIETLPIPFTKAQGLQSVKSALEAILEMALQKSPSLICYDYDNVADAIKAHLNAVSTGDIDGLQTFFDEGGIKIVANGDDTYHLLLQANYEILFSFGLRYNPSIQDKQRAMGKAVYVVKGINKVYYSMPLEDEYLIYFQDNTSHKRAQEHLKHKYSQILTNLEISMVG